MSNPICKLCDRTGSGVQFNMFPKTGHTFGELCVPCEGAWLTNPERTGPTARCGECSRVFDLCDEIDADEWAYGHDCEG